MRAHYDFKESIGKGTFAVVHRAVHRETGEVVAIKAVDKLLLDTETRALLKNELETMRLVSLHPGVPTLHRSYDDKDHTMFVMDFVRGGPLLDQIVQQRTFTENDARATFHSALRTLNFMAKIGVVHRDLKKTCWSMNCLLSGPSRYLTSASPPRSRLTSFSTRLSGLLFTLLRRSSGVAAIRVPVTFGLWV